MHCWDPKFKRNVFAKSSLCNVHHFGILIAIYLNYRGGNINEIILLEMVVTTSECNNCISVISFKFVFINFVCMLFLVLSFVLYYLLHVVS